MILTTKLPMIRSTTIDGNGKQRLPSYLHGLRYSYYFVNNGSFYG